MTAGTEHKNSFKKECPLQVTNVSMGCLYYLLERTSAHLTLSFWPLLLGDITRFELEMLE